MAFNRELSQFANYLSLDASANYIGITSAESTTNIGLGKAEPTSKLDVVGDGNFTGVITATSFHGDLVGNADTATSLETARDFSISGDAETSVVSFDGTANVGLAITFATVNNDTGSFGSSTEIPVFTVNEKGLVTAVTTAAVGTALTVTGDSGSENIDLLTESLEIAGGTNVTTSASGNAVTVDLDDNISLTSVTASGIITAAQFVTGASGEAIGISTNTITGPATLILDPAAVGDDTGKVVIKGDLQVDGTQTIINSTTVTVEDKNIQIADGAANDAAADGAGITVNSGDGNKTFQFSDANDSFQSSISLDVASGQVYKVNGSEVLSSDTLGSGVVNSSLTSVGTLGQLNVTGVTTSSGGFSGDLTGNVTGDLTGNADTATALETSRDFSVSGDVATASAVSFDGSGNVDLAVTLSNNFSANTSGIITASGGFVGDVTGNADTATALETARDFSISGDAEASAISFDGTANVGLALTLANTAVTPGSYGSSSEIPTFTVDSKGRLTAAGSVSVSTGMTVAGDSGSETINLLSETLTIAGGTNLTSSAASDTVTIDLDDNISLVSVTASGIITATSGFSGDLTGNVTGDLTGNADTATALETSRDFSISGDATASAVSFDGTANVGLALTLSDTAVTPGSYGSSTEIPTFTVDSKGRLTAAGTASVGTALTVSGDSGSEVIDLLSESLTIAGGTNLTSSAASDTVTIDLDDNISLTSVTASGIITAAQFVTGASGEAIGISTDTISGPATITIDPAAVGDDTGLVVIKGDLQVDGTQTIINSTTVTVNDLNVMLADGAANDAAADGGGITVQSGEGNKTFQFEATGDNFGSSENMNLASGKVYKINNTEVLSATALGSNVVSSSLTSVGTLGQLSVTGVTTSSGGFVGDLTGNADTATTLETSRDFSASGDASAPSVSFDGSGNVDLVLTLADTAVVAGSYGSSTEIPTFTVDSKGRLTAAGTASVGTALTVAGDSGSEVIDLLSESLTISGDTHVTTSASADTVTISVDATSANTNSTIVARDGSGGFVAGIVTATSFVGDLTGNVTGDVTGDLTGNVTGDLTGNLYASAGISTFNNIDINGTLTDANDGVGSSGQILISVGTGVSWRNLADSLPQTRTTDTQTATGGQTAFSFNYNVNYLDVFVNGVKLSSNDYTASNGTDITLSEAAFSGDVVEFHSYNTAGTGSGSVNSLNDLSDVTLSSSTSGNLLSYNGSAWVNSSNLNVGIITCTSVSASGDISAANINTTSDRNLKDNIRVVDGASELVSKLEGVHFTWKSNGQETIGVIAQQIEEHLPQLVQTGEDHKSVNYNGLIGVLIEAVKEQGSQIAALKAEIEELKK